MVAPQVPAFGRAEHGVIRWVLDLVHFSFTSVIRIAFFIQ